jgi:hypothetical protein
MSTVFNESALHYIDEVVDKYRKCLTQHAIEKARTHAGHRGEYQSVVTRENVQSALDEIDSVHDFIT